MLFSLVLGDAKVAIENFEVLVKLLAEYYVV